MNDPLIGIIGHARCGKDTLATRLIEVHGFTRVAFADPLKEALLDVDPYVDWCIDDDGEPLPFALGEVIDTIGWEEAKDVNPEVRRMLQNFGQAIRNIEPTFWLRQALTRAEAVGGPVVFTDVRYRNEADAIRAEGGLLIRLTRPGFDGANGHRSEHELDDYEADVVVVNDGTVADLHAQIDALLVGSPYPNDTNDWLHCQ